MFSGTQAAMKVVSGRSVSLSCKAKAERSFVPGRSSFGRDEKRIAEPDRRFLRLCEDNAPSRISDDRFAMTSRAHGDEQCGLKADAEVLRQEIETQEQQDRKPELFIQKVRKYADRNESTPHAAHELIGSLPLSERMKQEMA